MGKRQGDKVIQLDGCGKNRKEKFCHLIRSHTNHDDTNLFANVQHGDHVDCTNGACDFDYEIRDGTDL